MWLQVSDRHNTCLTQVLDYRGLLQMVPGYENVFFSPSWD